MTAHLICPSSQTEGPVVTPFGDIQMQTFSVTKKVQIWGEVMQIIICVFIYLLSVKQSLHVLLLYLFSLQRDSSDNVEASIVLSGMPNFF